MRKLKLILVLALLALAVGSSGISQANAKPKHWHLGMYDPGIHNVQNGVYYEFCGHAYVYCQDGDTAWEISDCESHHYLWAVNGEHLGQFQMGAGERKMFGHGNNSWAQSRAAKKYHDYQLKHGKWPWSPWTASMSCWSRR